MFPLLWWSGTLWWNWGGDTWIDNAATLNFVSEDFVKTGPNINVKQFTTYDKESGEDITYYKIVDNRGNVFPSRYMPEGMLNYFDRYEGQNGAKDIFDQLLPKFAKQWILCTSYPYFV